MIVADDVPAPPITFVVNWPAGLTDSQPTRAALESSEDYTNSGIEGCDQRPNCQPELQGLSHERFHPDCSG